MNVTVSVSSKNEVESIATAQQQYLLGKSARYFLTPSSASLLSFQAPCPPARGDSSSSSEEEVR